MKKYTFENPLVIGDIWLFITLPQLVPKSPPLQPDIHLSNRPPLLSGSPLSVSDIHCMLLPLLSCSYHPGSAWKRCKSCCQKWFFTPRQEVSSSCLSQFWINSMNAFLTFRIHIVSRIYVWDGDRWSKKIWIGGGALLHSVFWLITIVNRLLNVSEHPC